MVFGLIASNSKVMPPVFIKAGVKVSTDVYLDVFQKYVKPWMDSNPTPDDNVVLQQNGAPPHTSRETPKWLEDYIPNFQLKEMWPASSPSLNPLDCSIWTYVEKVCNKPHNSIEALKASIARERNKMSPEDIKNTCMKFRAEVEEVIANYGSRTE
ncbi:hypothetical protein SprV_0702248400 [Sparganum proliferum]